MVRILVLSERADYSRNRVLVSGLELNGAKIYRCFFPEKQSKLLTQYRLLTMLPKLKRLKVDFILVTYPCWFLIPFALFLSKFLKKPLITDAFVSLYDTNVYDRHFSSPGSLKSSVYYHVDRFTCKVSDLVILDTDESIKYFKETLNITNSCFKKVAVGSDDTVFYPRVAKSHECFHVLFWGTFIPLQGIEYIISAAKLLEGYGDIQFDIVGSGQTTNEIRQLQQKLGCINVHFHMPVPYEKLAELVADADICLGIFGGTPKAKRVIPNKVYESLAMGKPLVTGDSLAIRELLVDGENCVLCEMANPKALAEAVLALKNNRAKQVYIAGNGLELFRANSTPRKIGSDLLEALSKFKK